MIFMGTGKKGFLSPAHRKKILSFAKREVAGNDEYHDLAHLLQVAKNALFLAKREGGDPEVCWASAILHDICKCKRGDHGTEGATKAGNFLKSLELPEPFIRKVHDAIHFHNKEFRGGPIERRILWDADKLTIIGPYWFTQRHLPYQVSHNGRGKGIPIAVEEYRFFEKRFHTKTAKKIVAENAPAMRPFFRLLLKENREVHSGGP